MITNILVKEIIDLQLSIRYDNNYLIKHNKQFLNITDDFAVNNELDILIYCKNHIDILEMLKNDLNKLEKVIETPNIKNNFKIYNNVKNNLNNYKNNIIMFQEEINITLKKIIKD